MLMAGNLANPGRCSPSCSFREEKEEDNKEEEEVRRGYIQHPVSKLDTLAGIAIKYGVEVADIKRCNGLVNDLQMFAHKTLKVPLLGKHPPSAVSLSSDSSGLMMNSTPLSREGQCRVEPPKRVPSSSLKSLLRGYSGLSSLQQPDDDNTWDRQFSNLSTELNDLLTGQTVTSKGQQFIGESPSRDRERGGNGMIRRRSKVKINNDVLSYSESQEEEEEEGFADDRGAGVCRKSVSSDEGSCSSYSTTSSSGMDILGGLIGTFLDNLVQLDIGGVSSNNKDSQVRPPITTTTTTLGHFCKAIYCNKDALD